MRPPPESHRPGLRVLVAPSGLKESLTADQAADAIAAGVRRATPDAEVTTAPVPDGGEGFARGLVQAVGGSVHTVTVSGPIGDPVDARYAFLDGQDRPTAVLAMSSAAGLHLLPTRHRDPLVTTTRGVGELVLAAIDAGACRILVGCGDSGTSDGGAGMVRALGAELLDAGGRPIGPGGGALAALDRLDVSGLDPRLAGVDIEAAVNPTALLGGPDGVARVFGPQKGASPADVVRLETGLARWADVLTEHCGRDLRLVAGSGASGGLGAGLAALLGATLVPRFEMVSRYLDLDALLDAADLVLTAEGSLDGQSAHGKVPGDLGRRAAALGVPVIALVGRVDDGARELLDAGLDAWHCILTGPCSLAEAQAHAEEALGAAAEQVVRSVLVGGRLRCRAADRP